MNAKKLSPARIHELREYHNPVFDELLDVLEAQTEEYQAWITELEGPTPALAGAWKVWDYHDKSKPICYCADEQSAKDIDVRLNDMRYTPTIIQAPGQAFSELVFWEHERDKAIDEAKVEIEQRNGSI